MCEIMLVTDDADTRARLTAHIEAETPYRVAACASGGELLTRLREKQEPHPRLFIFDSALTGESACGALLACHGCEHIPALIMTAAPADSAFQALLAKRHVTLLPKPIQVAELLDCIERLLTHPAQLI